MNCKHVEPLLSLYVGRDLEEEQSRLVAAHLQSCTECSLAADEYDVTSQLLQRYEAPFFSDEIYAGIRGQVLNQIEAESHARVWPGVFSQLFLALVQPRMRWITAALLLAISVTALYLSRNRSHQPPNDQRVAVRNRDESAPGPPLVSNKEEDSMVVPRRPITRKRKARVDASTSDRVVQRNVVLSQPSSAAATLRVEMQTSNRNIRIIWLSPQRPSATGTDGSKGI